MARTFKVSLLFCLLTLFSLVFTTYPSMSEPTYMHTFCNQIRSNFTSNSLYESNRDTLLAGLRARSSLSGFANATFGLVPNIVRGMFLCRGDVSTKTCQSCVSIASSFIVRNCTDSEEAFVFYEECMVRFSDLNFFSVNEDRPYIVRYTIGGAPNLDRFPLTLSEKMNELITKVSLSSSSTPYFVQDQERVTELGGSYELDSMVQCSPDLDPTNCTECLRLASQEMVGFSNRSQWAQLFTPKCLVRFETTTLQSPSPPRRSFDPFNAPPSPTFFSIPSGSFSINMKGKGTLRIGVPVIASVLAIFAL